MLRRCAPILLVSCGVGGVDKPDAPVETPAVVASFTTPTGSLAAQSAGERAQLLSSPLSGLRLLCGSGSGCHLTETVARTLSKVADALDEREGRDGGRKLPSIPGASGLLDVTTICDGWGEPSPDPAHGHYLYQVGFTGRGFDPTGSGQFDACEMLIEGSALRATGRMLYTFEQRVPFAEIANAPITIAFDGTVQTASEQYPVRAAVRSTVDASPELSFELPGFGTFLAVFDGDTVDVRGRDQTLRCTLQEMACEPSP